MESTGISRSGVNFFSVLLTCLILLLAFELSSSVKTPDKGPEYKDINVTAKYESNTDYDPEGLDWLYETTKNFMDLILDDAIPKDVISISKNNDIKIDLTNHVSDVLVQYAYVVALCAVIAIFALVMFVTGFCFTCYCCCKLTRSNKHAEKNQTCKKITLITLLTICGVLITFAGVYAFIANNRLHDGIQEFPDDLRKSVKDAKTFLEVTDEQISILLNDNFIQFSTWISSDIDERLETVDKDVKDLMRDMDVDNIFNTLNEFNNIATDVNSMIYSITPLRNSAKPFQTSIDSLIRLLENGCPEEIKDKCESNIRPIENLKFDLLSDDVLANFSKVGNIKEYVIEAKNQYNQIPRKINDTITSTKNTANEQIVNAGNTIKENVDKISSEIKKLETYLPDTTDIESNDGSFLHTIQEFVENYDPYINYVGGAICGILFLLIGLLAFGMICGCGRISFFKVTGSAFLLSATTMMFYFTIVLGALILIYFSVGLITQQAVCKSLRDPSNSAFFDLVDQYDLSQFGLDSKVSNILQSIRNGESAYNVFNLQTKFDLNKIDDYLDEFKKALNEVKDLAKKFDLKNMKLLTEEQLANLESVNEPDISIINSFLTALGSKINADAIGKIVTSLESIVEHQKETKFGIILEYAIKDLHQKFTNIVAQNLTTTIGAIQTDLENLKNDLKLGQGSFTAGMSQLVNNIKKAQEVLQVQGPISINKVVDGFTNETFGFCKDYVDRVKGQVKDDVGICKPLGVIYDATLTSVCDKVGQQLNSVWFLLLWSMLVFLPTVIISSKLASLYKSEVPVKSTKKDATQIPKRPRTKKTDKSEQGYVTPVGSNRNADLLSWKVDDITLDKWEQYPPSNHGHNSKAKEEYKKPPPYFFTEFNTVANSSRFNDNKFDELSRWTQYPESSTRF